MFWFDFCFRKAAEAVNFRQNDRLALQRINRVWNAIVDAKELWSVNQKASISKSVSGLFLFLLVIFLEICQVPLSKKSRNVLR